MAGHGGAGCAAVLAFNDLAEFFHCHLVAAYFDKGADDGAYHVAQETVGRDGEYPLLALLNPLSMGDAAVVGLNVGVQLGEGGEVSEVQQTGGSLVHEFEVKIRRTFPAQEIAERVLAGDCEVLVGAAGGVEAGVSVVMNRCDAADGDVCRQQSIEAVNQAVDVVDGLLGVEVRDHQPGVHAGIGAARSSDGSGHAQQSGHRFLDDLLHRRVMGLHLPAMVGRPPVAQTHEIPHDDDKKELFLEISVAVEAAAEVADEFVTLFAGNLA